jgi:hypothetical protein
MKPPKVNLLLKNGIIADVSLMAISVPGNLMA